MYVHALVVPRLLWIHFFWSCSKSTSAY